MVSDIIGLVVAAARLIVVDANIKTNITLSCAIVWRQSLISRVGYEGLAAYHLVVYARVYVCLCFLPSECILLYSLLLYTK